MIILSILIPIYLLALYAIVEALMPRHAPKRETIYPAVMVSPAPIATPIPIIEAPAPVKVMALPASPVYRALPESTWEKRKAIEAKIRGQKIDYAARHPRPAPIFTPIDFNLDAPSNGNVITIRGELCLA
jgi:hypothetical protein